METIPLGPAHTAVRDAELDTRMQDCMIRARGWGRRLGGSPSNGGAGYPDRERRGKSLMMMGKEVTTRYGKTCPAPDRSRRLPLFQQMVSADRAMAQSLLSGVATESWTRKRGRARDAEARFTRCAASPDWAAPSRCSCAGSVDTRNLRPAVQPPCRDPHVICRSARAVRERRPPPMRELLAALTAFFDEHQRCGELDGGRDNGHIWLGCSCGARIAHPAGASSPASAESPKLPIARMPE